MRGRWVISNPVTYVLYYTCIAIHFLISVALMEADVLHEIDNDCDHLMALSCTESSLVTQCYALLLFRNRHHTFAMLSFKHLLTTRSVKQDSISKYIYTNCNT